MSKLNDFHYAMYLADTMYGVKLTKSDFEEIGTVAFGKIGNNRTSLVRKQLPVDSKGYADIPCDCFHIEALCYGFKDWDENDSLDGNNIGSQYAEEWIEGQKISNDPYYQGGRFVKYQQEGDRIHIDLPYNGPVFLLYHKKLSDKNGLPFITDKEANAIAAFCAYTQKYKEGLITNNPQIIQVSMTLKSIWSNACDAARVPEYISQNDMDLVLDTVSSWDRKMYGKSYKAIK